jgi:hypothetical protein
VSASEQLPADPIDAAVRAAGDALLHLARIRPELAIPLVRFTTAVAEEASRSTRFANALRGAIATGGEEPPATKRTGRRAPGVLDPFAVYSEGGEPELRQQLGALDLEQLRDIVAEHGMDHDRLAMKWKDAGRVIDRIVEKVATRAAKGSAFRGPRE